MGCRYGSIKAPPAAEGANASPSTVVQTGLGQPSSPLWGSEGAPARVLLTSGRVTCAGDMSSSCPGWDMRTLQLHQSLRIEEGQISKQKGSCHWRVTGWFQETQGCRGQGSRPSFPSPFKHLSPF